MPMDTFICGTCQVTFNEIESFIVHKKECQSNPSQITDVLDANLPQQFTNNAYVPTVEQSDNSATLINESTGEQTVIIIQPGTDQDEITRRLMDGSFTLTDLQNATFSALEPNAVPSELQSIDTQVKPYTGKKRGRPKKSESSKVEAQQPIEKQKPSSPDRDSEGRLVCKCCKRKFTKERFFNTHKCMGFSDYVDISRKQAIGDSGPEESDEDNDPDDVIKLEINESETDEEISEDADFEVVGEVKKRPRKRQKTKNDNMAIVQVTTDPDAEDDSFAKATDAIEDIPVFKNDEEKRLFEASINIDLSCVDHLFQETRIEQELNDKVPMLSRINSNVLSLYTCNVCNKIFKTLSHMRLHALIHTDFKPFACSKCNYATNSKGNLYTHTRKHTGQYYRCRNCDFKSVNKTHLLEHEATHSSQKAKCDICKRDYNTLKSLINHVRKYHLDTAKGQAYLETFLTGRRNSGTTVIHQCHVCNRKFKKKIDRDRHLFVHDIKDLPNIQSCMLCDYTASRRIYLEKHFLKHRILYKCCECQEVFLSSVKLSDHLSSLHVQEEVEEQKWEVLFEKSIENSMYLPEPDHSYGPEELEYVNLPPELSGAELNKSTDEATGPSPVVMQAQSTSVANKPDSGNPTTAVQENETSGLVTTQTGKTLEEEQAAEVIVNLQVDSVGEITVSKVADENTAGGENQDNQDSEITCIAEVQNIEGGIENQPDEIVNILEIPEDIISQKEDKNSIVILNESSNAANDATMSDEMAVVKNTDNATESVNDNDIASAALVSTEANDTTESVTPVAENEDPNKEDENDETEDVDNISIDPEEFEMEGEEEENKNLSKKEKLEKLIDRLGYSPMTMQIFHKMRETFGHEECEFCGKLFYNKNDFDNHMRTHTGDKPFSCITCGFKAATKEVLSHHKEQEHRAIIYPCQDCEFVAVSRSQLWNHSIQHKGLGEAMGLECPLCQQKLQNMKKFKQHVSESHPDITDEENCKIASLNRVKMHKVQGKLGRRSYKCPYCDKVFYRANSELQKHIWIHEGIKPYKCPLCPHSCRSKNNLQAHMLRHSDEKPYTCGECGKPYKSKTALRWHIRSHADGKIFKCDKCSYEATQRSHLKRHMETHEIVKRYCCQHCDYSANTVGYMKIHYTRNHRGEQFVFKEAEVVSKPESQLYRCLSCDYLFGNLSDLKRHLKIRHHLQFQQIQGIDQNSSEVQVIQCDSSNMEVQESEIVTSDIIQPIQATDAPVDMLDEKTASAVNILQQIINMQSQNVGGQQFTLQSEDGQILSVNPGSIIVQDGQEVVVSNGNTEGNQQYVIQYVTAQDGIIEDPGMVEVQDVQTIQGHSLQEIEIEPSTLDVSAI